MRHPRGLGPHDHVCWTYREPAEFRRQAGEFLTEGLALGQRVRLVGNGSTAELTETLRELGLPPEDPAVEVVPVREGYPGLVVDPHAQVRACAEATELALAEGFRGLRVATEATELVRGDEALTAFLRYEHLIDRYMVDKPFAALCAYDRTRLSEQHLTRLAAVHPITNSALPGFHLHATDADGCAAVLSGELDLTTEDTLAELLRRVPLQRGADELVLNAEELTFIDHRSLLLLTQHAGDTGARLVLRTAQPVVRQVAALLELPNLKVEDAA
ncbi:MEDS domain-containing protein [Crossiella sp. CA-258035]|uniref:MEDS domain-containing protein n=1 Tax=Crossiella sp. CA-258035 TaxID=2981138 RepID=UPI0024BD34DB|nr:MEDS domain-containing protein [Crossiella sp. CA-258035]WHT22682.1 MEDS domain-containing protein [Crossiella sp. CA-258035]